jgi:predicted metal-dependent hydrolase
VLLCPIRTARRMRLRFDEARQVLKLTHPRGVSRKIALGWAAKQRGWVSAQIGRAEPSEPFVSGAVIPVNGGDVRLCWSPEASRTPRLQDGCLVAGGPEAGFARRVEQFLKRLALDTLSSDTAEIAARAAVKPAAVGVGDAATRWGSCSSTRRIRYSWRLILAPPEVRRYVVAHEVAHLEHLNHGPQFKALERELYAGDIAGAQRLLRLIGPRLKRIGRRG